MGLRIPRVRPQTLPTASPLLQHSPGHGSSRHAHVLLPDSVPGLLPSQEACYQSNKMICKIFKRL